MARVFISVSKPQLLKELFDEVLELRRLVDDAAGCHAGPAGFDFHELRPHGKSGQGKRPVRPGSNISHLPH